MQNSSPDTDDHETFMRLLLEHEPMILRAVMVLVPQRADARDIVQDTAVALWQQFSQYDRSRPFLNWALGFARIHIRRYFRSVERRGKLTEKAMEALLIAADQEAETVGLAEKEAAALQLCLGDLPEPSRSIIEGYYFHEQTVEALGFRFGKSTEAIYKSLQRLRRVLSDCITHRLSAV